MKWGWPSLAKLGNARVLDPPPIASAGFAPAAAGRSSYMTYSEWRVLLGNRIGFDKIFGPESVAFERIQYMGGGPSTVYPAHCRRGSTCFEGAGHQAASAGRRHFDLVAATSIGFLGYASVRRGRARSTRVGQPFEQRRGMRENAHTRLVACMEAQSRWPSTSCWSRSSREDEEVALRELPPTGPASVYGMSGRVSLITTRIVGISSTPKSSFRPI